MTRSQSDSAVRPNEKPERVRAELPRSRWSSFRHQYRPDLFAIAWVPYALLVWRFWFVTDDAFISYRYAQNFVRGCGLRFNLGDPVPVEGYSNFLWVMICSVFEFFRMDITFWPLLVSAVCGSVLLWLVFDVLRRRLELHPPVAVLATLALGCYPPLAVWSLQRDGHGALRAAGISHV